ncbi:DUF6879 family protein [Streptomyces virginiae]|uniref:DUF6879 family protein n=1 Tax=Streptomyces TaxID=1883 RepID=UPI000AC0DBF8|nr:DUF6879 family protein [Streptomyces sp. MJM1172]
MALEKVSILNDFFDEFEHTAWRLETRESYASDLRSDRYQRFIQGGGYTPEGRDGFLAERRRLAGEGKKIQRVRIVDQPLTNNQRYLLASAPWNTEAGEEIKYLWRDQSAFRKVPLEDFWLFDSSVLARFHFEGDETIGVELIREPAEVLRACQVRDLVEHHAFGYAELTRWVLSRG